MKKEKCSICGDEPAYYSKQYGNFLCQKHQVHVIKKMLIGALVAGAAYLIMTYFGVI